jgi:hypothetical protein
MKEYYYLQLRVSSITTSLKVGDVQDGPVFRVVVEGMWSRLGPKASGTSPQIKKLERFG